MKHLSGHASFSPQKMGKTTIAQGDFLFAGLNCFEPGQEHAPHAHEGQDKLYVISKAPASSPSAKKRTASRPATQPSPRPASCIRFATPALTASS